MKERVWEYIRPRLACMEIKIELVSRNPELFCIFAMLVNEMNKENIKIEICLKI